MATELSNLPEGCVAKVISFTTPRDACRFSVVSSLFHSAADSDEVWERLVTPDLLDIAARTDGDTQNQLLLLLRDHPKKKYFVRLIDSPIIFDSGHKSFSLDKSSGKICLMIAARKMSIVWADTPRYWNWVSVPESRFQEVAQLLNVCWLEMSLRMEASVLPPEKTYVAYLVFQLTDGYTGLEEIPVETSVGMPFGVKDTKIIFLASEDDGNYGTNIEYPKRRADGWMEAELGEVFVDGGGQNGGMVEVQLAEVKQLNWKHGLVIEGIEFRPKA